MYSSPELVECADRLMRFISSSIGLVICATRAQVKILNDHTSIISNDFSNRAQADNPASQARWLVACNEEGWATVRWLKSVDMGSRISTS